MNTAINPASLPEATRDAHAAPLTPDFSLAPVTPLDGRELVKALVDGGLSQGAIGKVMGCGQTFVSFVFNGKRPLTDPEKLAKLATEVERIRTCEQVTPIGVNPDAIMPDSVSIGPVVENATAESEPAQNTEPQARPLEPESVVLAEHAENEIRKDFDNVERVAIAKAIEEEIGNRRGQRTDLKSEEQGELLDDGLRKNFNEVEGKRTDQVAAEKAGFGNRETYRQAKAVVEKAEPESVVVDEIGDAIPETEARGEEMAGVVGEPNILSGAIDPLAEDLAHAVNAITAAIESLDEDPGAALTPEAVDAWAHIYAHDRAEYERLRDKAKKGKARVAEIDREIGARSKYAKQRAGNKKTEKISQSYTSSTSSTDKGSSDTQSYTSLFESSTSSTDKGSSDTQSYTSLFESSTSSTEPLPLKPKALVRESEKGPRLEIASDAALIVAGVLKGRFAYCTTAETWHGFTGTHWEPLASPAPLYEALTRWMFPATEDVGFTPRYQDSILTVIQRAGMRSLPKAPNAIPFSNGLLDIETGVLSPITPTNAATWALPYEYQPGADCPRVKAWLLQAVGDDRDVVELLRAFLAALIRGGAYLQRFLHLIGPGGTGKSTFLRLIEALVGERNAVTTDLKELEQNRFESAALYGKRAALITDSDRYGGSVNKLKAITGQDPVRLERKHVQQSGSFIFEGMVFLASNEPLATTDYTSGIERRRVTIHFERRVSEQEKAAWNALGGEKAVLHAELPGVVNWLLTMPIVEMERRIRHPPEHTMKANLEAMCSGNPCADWLTDCCVPDLNEWTQIGECEERRNPDDGEVYYLHADARLFPSYLAWCKKSGRLPLSQRRFRSVVLDAIKTLGFDALDARRAEGRGIKGVRLRNQGEEPFSWHSGVSSVACAGSAVSDAAQNAAPSRASAGSDGYVTSRGHIPPAHSRANTDDDCADSEVF